MGLVPVPVDERVTGSGTGPVTIAKRVTGSVTLVLMCHRCVITRHSEKWLHIIVAAITLGQPEWIAWCIMALQLLDQGLQIGGNH